MIESSLSRPRYNEETCKIRNAGRDPDTIISKLILSFFSFFHFSFFSILKGQLKFILSKVVGTVIKLSSV